MKTIINNVNSLNSLRIKDIIIVIFILIVFSVAITDGRDVKPLPITSLTIQFDKTGAVFTINYSFDTLPKTYLLIFGSKSLEPKINLVFSNFDYDVVRIDPDVAILKVKNISRLVKGFYLHDSHKFGETIDTVYISDSYGSRTFFNVNSTPDYFYK